MQINKMKDQNKENSLGISKYQDWFDVIISDNLEKAEKKFANSAKTDIEQMVSWEFDFEDDTLTNVYTDNRFRIHVPLHLAVAFCSRKIIKLLLSHNAKLLQIDQYQRNLLHSSATLVLSLPHLEKEICDTISWLAKEVNKDDWRVLQFQENKDGLRPLEYAAQQGCLKVVKTLLETEGYCSCETVSGLGLFRMHDITEYETGSRHGISPLHMLAYLDEKKLQDPDTQKILLSPLIKSWIDGKIRSNLLLILAWVIMRLVFIIGFISLDADVGWIKRRIGNFSESVICPELGLINLSVDERRAFTVILFIIVFVALLMDLIDLINWRWKRHYLKNYHLRGSKTLVSNTRFFLVNNLLLTLAITFCVTYYLIANINNTSADGALLVIIDIGRGLVPVLSMWYLAYFLQLLPYIGFSIINVQNMVAEMSKFLLIFFMCLLPFVHVFEAFIMVNSNTGCISEFSTPLATSYTLFRTMLGQYDVRTLDVNNIGVVYGFHLLYTFLVTILMLNFLIAIMSSTASVLNDHQSVILIVNQLSIAVRLEERIFWFTKPLYRRLRKLGFHCEHDHVYLTSIANRIGKLFQKRLLLEEESKDNHSSNSIETECTNI